VPVLDLQGGHRATVLVTFPAALVEGKARRQALSVLGVGLLVLVLGTAALVAALSVSLTRPLARLIQRLQEMRGGSDLSRRVALPAGGDLRQLAEAFNGLLGDLQETTVSRGELAEAMRVLERTEERYRRLVETAPSAILVDCGDRLVFVNPAGARLLGAGRPEELLGLPLLPFVHPESRPALEEHERALLGGAAQAQGPELKLLRLDGVQRQVEVTAIAFDYADRPAVQLVMRDVTEHRAMQAQLVATGRLISLGTMAQGMAHEINNPLTSVVSGLQFLGAELRDLADRLPPERLEELRSAVADALQGATRVRQLVSDLQAYSRDQVLLDAVELEPVLELAASMASSQLRDRARFVKAYPPLPRVLGNEARLGQVFLNLLLNAALAIAPGRPEANEVRLEARLDGPWVEVEVRDSGAGIPADVRGRIFDPFFTTRATGEGSGLGLFVAHGLLKGMGGRIRFESQPGAGTSFFVALPLAAPAQDPAA
jgi:PAS domain S-box-containing protein